MVIVHEVKELRIFMEFYEQDKRIKRTLIITTVPDERVYSTFLGRLEWLSDDRIVLISKDGESYTGAFG